MTSRRAACDPCRKAKLACGHERPVCARCRHSKKASACVYRASPFKRRPHGASSPGAVIRSPRISRVTSNEPREAQELRETSDTPRRNAYPNPGYLGQSSHVTIFSHIFSDENLMQNESPSTPSPAVSLEDHPSAKQAAELTRQLLTSFDLNALEDLVAFWFAKGVNLAVAEPFVQPCARSSNFSSLSTFQGENWHIHFATRLLQNSVKPLNFGPNSTLLTYATQFTGSQSRWETFGIFLSAAIRAAMDIPFFPSLYTTSIRNRELRHLLIRLIDCCLQVGLSLESLNDLHLVLQYENFIIHSYVDGDQSYRYWRILGDLISTLLALGYHENVAPRDGTPRFLIELRKTAFARTYSADKNVSMFLGRPPRICKKFCHFKLPRCPPGDDDDASPSDSHLARHEWRPDVSMSYRAETRWSALCASIKEEILELLFDRNGSSTPERVRALQTRADELWAALPPHFRFEGSLRQSNNSPFERDFLISVRLNYLQLLFLLNRLLLRRLSEPDAASIDIAQQILHLVTDAILLRDELANSGTGLDWKISYFGLPAAGILLLAILRQQRERNSPRVPLAQILQDLTVLVAEVERGTIVRTEEPNYALLSEATQTIQRFLKFIHSGDRVDVIFQEQPQAQNDEGWLAQLDQDPWNFDVGFWQGLVDQTSIFTSELLPSEYP